MSFFGTIVVFIVIKRASGVNSEHVIGGDGVESANQESQPNNTENEVSPEKWKLLIGAGKVLSLLALCATGSLQPSLPSFIYYLVFLGAATFWGCNKELERCEIIFSNFHIQRNFHVMTSKLMNTFRAFGIVLRVTLFFIVGHLTAFLAYQNPWPQEFLAPNSTVPRLVTYFDRDLWFRI